MARLLRIDVTILSLIQNRSFVCGNISTLFAPKIYLYISLSISQSKLRSYVGRDEQIKRINDLQDYITQQTAYLTEFDETLVQCWIKQITIWENRITVELKSGVSIDVDA